MPTNKPRITITLTEHQHSVLSALSGLQKSSMSSIVVDLVDATLPVLERLADVLGNAATAPKNVLDELRRSAEIAEADVPSGYKIIGLLDELLHRSSSPASREGESPAYTERGAGAEARPPTSNRGVRITSPRSKIGPISPMKKGEKNGRAQK